MPLECDINEAVKLSDVPAMTTMKRHECRDPRPRKISCRVVSRRRRHLFSRKERLVIGFQSLKMKMRMSLAASKKEPNPQPVCLVRVVANALATEPALEAVTLNRNQQAVSVALLGKEKNSQLVERIATTVEQARKANSGQPCGLLQGEPDCQNCAVPFAPIERQSITIQHAADSTTIARVTCPTAPRFWHWREIPWPKFGP